MATASEREIAAAPLALPASLAPLVQERSWLRDTVGETGAAVHRLHAPGAPDLYLKHGAGDQVDAVTDEMVRMRWLAGRLAVPAIRGFVLDDTGAWLLMTRLPGRTAYQWLADRAADRGRVVDLLADHLRTVHALPAASCPFEAGHGVRLAQARARIDAGLVETDEFDAERAGWSAERVWDAMMRLLPFASDRVVTHGDFSLDNILIGDDGAVGTIDLGRVGVADGYQDLAILWNCLGEFDAALGERLFAAYGIAVPDERRLRFHLCLDEMF